MSGVEFFETGEWENHGLHHPHQLTHIIVLKIIFHVFSKGEERVLASRIKSDFVTLRPIRLMDQVQNGNYVADSAIRLKVSLFPHFSGLAEVLANSKMK